VVKHEVGGVVANFGPELGERHVPEGHWASGFRVGFIVQDVPLSAVRRTLGLGTVVAMRSIGDSHLVAVQIHETGETRWFPFERLARILDPRLQYLRAEERFEDSGERTALNLMSHALRTWNEATGALERLDIDPLPHQITLVHRIIGSGSSNWLVADDVGLGKTIEVGLLLGAMERKQNIRRILVIVPSGLTRQWKSEMQTKFNRAFRIYGRDFEVERPEDWGLYDHVIASLDLVKPRSSDDEGVDFATRFGALLSAKSWDIVIFDEAHRLSRDEAGRQTLRFKLATALRKRTDALLLLSGTPHQGDVGKFQNLLKLVRPDLSEQIDDLEADPSFVADIVLRNRKIDVVDAEGNFIFHGVLVRLANIPNSPETVELERRLSAYLSRGYQAGARLGGRSGRAIGFVMTIYRKLASSSVWTLLTAMRRRRARLLGEAVEMSQTLDLEYDEPIEVADGEDAAAEIDYGNARSFFEEELEAIDGVIQQAEACLHADRKLLEMMSIVGELVSGQRQKLLIFTEFRATQEYLQRKLLEELGVASVMINGAMSVDEKHSSIEAFESDVAVLISTEAGGEGLNLQKHCHVLVNYDIPWNPARLQQRIGRLYRYGQSKKVVVVNMTSTDTIDNEILTTMLTRLHHVVKQMSSVSSEYDDRHQSEVLGELLDRIDINDLLEEARSGAVERTAERVDRAIDQAQRARSLQDDILSGVSTLSSGGWTHLGSFSTLDLANFIKRAAVLSGIDVTLGDDPERFDLRLSDTLRGRFSEFGGRTVVPCRTRRDGVTTGSRVLLDFSSALVRFLVDNVSRPEFGGGYGVLNAPDLAPLLAAAVVHYQNEQGEQRGVDLLVAGRTPNGDIRVDNGLIKPLFNGRQTPGKPVVLSADGRKAAIDALLERIEVDVASAFESGRHANSLFAVGVIENNSDRK